MTHLNVDQNPGLENIEEKVKTAGVGVFFSFVSVAGTLSWTQKILPKLPASSALYSTPSRYRTLANKVCCTKAHKCRKIFLMVFFEGIVENVSVPKYLVITCSTVSFHFHFWLNP